MPIIRRVITLGPSKVITLPKSWIKYFEKELGVSIKEVTIEVNKQLIITPYLSKQLPKGVIIDD